MNFVALGLYGIAAAGGMILAIRVFKETDSPMLLAILHMAFAVAGAGTLFAYITSSDALSPLFTYALMAYGAAALGGLYMFSFRFRSAGTYPPHGMVFFHGSVAVLGTMLLLAASLG